MPWNDKFECMPVDELQKFQLEKLKETVAWLAEKIPFYQKKFKELIASDYIIEIRKDLSGCYENPIKRSFIESSY